VNLGRGAGTGRQEESVLRRSIRYGVALAATLAVLAALLVTYRFFHYQDNLWFAGYRQWASERIPAAERRKPIHVMVMMADHFEPLYFEERVRRWEVGYPAFADRHRDHEGRVMQHTWFFPGDQVNHLFLQTLAGLVGRGYGEVELHYHHGFDTYSSFERRLNTAIAAFQEHGFLKTVDGQTRYGFVHGNFGLDNSSGDVMCGVNEEIRLLLSTGCYADFTFPSIREPAQPSAVNKIYEAVDDPGPKSYDKVYPVTGVASPDRLMIFEGPLIAFFSPRTLYRVEVANINATPTTADRVDMWIDAGVHVAQQPDWIFVKMWTHGVQSDEDIAANLGVGMDAAMFYLEAKYNDGVNYVLHYVTAREAYNVARAAAAGRTGNPAQYYDYDVKPYLADHRAAAAAQAAVTSATPLVPPRQAASR
jgi:hypothetical protein